MAHGFAAAHQPGSIPFASQWQAIFQYPWPLLSHLSMLQGREFRQGTTRGAGAISRAIAVGGLTLFLGGNPMAVAITNDGDGDDQDERVFITQFFAERIPGGPGEGFDTGKRGIV